MGRNAMLFAAGAIVVLSACAAMGWAFGTALKASNWRDQARAYCERHGAVLVVEYCLTEAELVLRRVPERF